jgi:hypothetical protein
MIQIEIAVTILLFMLGGMGVVIRMLRKSDMDKITESLGNIVAATEMLRKDVQENYVRKEAVNGHLREIRAEQTGQRALINQRFHHIEEMLRSIKSQ